MIVSVRDINSNVLEEIKRLYCCNRNKDISAKCGCTVGVVERVAVKHGLKKDKEYLNKIKKEVLVRRNKEMGRDLNKENLKKIALQYETKAEFCYYDGSAYSAANRKGLMKDITAHMVNCSFSVPQIILKQITQDLFKQRCRYNDRKAIKPYELDIYYPNLKIAFEYDGKGWHQNDNICKTTLCSDVGVTLLTFKERSRRYEEDIKQHLVENIDAINKVTGLNLLREDILKYNKTIKLPKLFTEEELQLLRSNDKSFLFQNHYNLYERYRRYNPDNLEFTNTKWTEASIEEEMRKYTTKRDFIDKSKGAYLALHRRHRNLIPLYKQILK